MFEEDAGGGQAIRDLAREVGVPLQFGSDQVERGPTPRCTHAAFVARRPTGARAAVYRKIQLVPFGEFIPLQRVGLVRRAARRRRWQPLPPATR